MKMRNVNGLTTALSAILLAGSQVYAVQAADQDYSGIAAPPKFTPSTGSYPLPPPGGWDGVVDSIDKQIESDMKQVESSRPADIAPMTDDVPQFGGGARFPEFQDPPEWGQREIPEPPEWADRGAPAPPAWAERDTSSQPDWARSQTSQAPEWGSSRYAPPEWGGGQMPAPAEWGDRSLPEPPMAAQRGMPEPAQQWSQGTQAPQQWGQGTQAPQQWGQGTQAPQQRGQGAEPQPPSWAGRNIPDPPDWSRGTPSYPPPRYDRGPGYRTPWDSGRGPSFGTSRGPSVRGPWDSGRYGRRDDFSPFGSSGPNFRSPWDSGRGGRSMPWSSKKGRGGWMDRDWFADSWDDMMNAPADMGEMPGGWYAPTISTPNPVDVGDEFGTAAQDMPTQMRNVYDDNRRYDRGGYDSYDRYEGGYSR